MKRMFLLASLVLAVTTCFVFAGCKKKPTENPFTQKEDSGQFGKKVHVLTEEEIIEKQTKEKLAMENFGIINEMSQQLPAAAFKERTDVQYGTVKHETYYSKTCRMERPFNILLPAGYDGQKKYPVVYFQHGIFGDENSIIQDDNNKVKQIAANLAADGKAKEMIFVFGHMYATDDPNQKPGFDPKAVLPYDNFLNELVNDLMPYIESHYAVLTGRDNTAVCGFSMGGRESLYIGLNRPDLFGYIGAIAPAPGLVPGKDGYMAHDGSLQESQVKFENTIPHFVMICCGTQDSVVGKFPKSYHELFKANAVDHEWFEVQGADHNHIAIRTGLYYFIQRIF
jgi:enterochelin esterase-like enzyme